MLYKIDPTQYGLTSGSFGKPPYTAGQYLSAYNNGVGIQNAINFAYDNGYEGVVLPKSATYTLCYASSPATTLYTSSILYPKSNQRINLNGCVLEIMYDSINKSPYHTRNESVWKLEGSIFGIVDVYNVKIENGELKGDIYNRSFTDGGTGVGTSEKGMQGTYGIRVLRNYYSVTASKLRVHGFMGDSIGASSKNINTGLVTPNIGDAVPGYINSDGSITQIDGTYYSPKITVNFTNLKALSPSIDRVVQITTAGGYTRVPSFADPKLQIAFYDVNDVFLSKRNARYMDRINLPYNMSYMRIQFVNEAVGLTTLPNPGYSISEQLNTDLVIEDCWCYDNHRGGISGGADGTVIQRCHIFNNGTDSGLGIPVFPDSTRYAIDFEDSYCDNVVVRDCHIYNGIEGVLLGAYDILVEGNIISNFVNSGVKVYSGNTAVIRDNKFVNSAVFGLAGSTEGRKIQFKGNRVFNKEGSSMDTSSATDKDFITIEDNYIECRNIYIKGANIDMLNNKIYAADRQVTAQTSNIFVDVNGFYNNVIDGSKNLGGSGNTIVWKQGARNNIKGFTSIAFALTTYGTITFQGAVFTDCTLKGGYSTNASSFDNYIGFRDCEFINSQVYMYSAPNTTVYYKSGAIFENCRFKIDLLPPVITNENKATTVTEKDYYVHMYTPVIEYINATKPALVASFYGNNIGMRTMVRVINARVINNDTFLSKITSAGKY